jgi:uncharacterized protein (TIGR03437 family)
VSGGQANFQVPGSTASGKATVTIRKQDGSTVSGSIFVDSVAPGVFSANASGEGVGLIAAVRADSAGNRTNLAVSRYDAAQSKYVAVPISLGGESDQVYLILYGTGIRGEKVLSNVTAQVGGTSVPVTYAAAQSEYAGLDQVNIGPLPRSLAGKGEVAIVVTVAGYPSNSVTMQLE